jgi:hypothetical protein
VCKKRQAGGALAAVDGLAPPLLHRLTT